MPVFAVLPKGSACDATVAFLLLVVSSQIPVTEAVTGGCDSGLSPRSQQFRPLLLL